MKCRRILRELQDGDMRKYWSGKNHIQPSYAADSSSAFKHLPPQDFLCHTPVSYTHLDVYKRQGRDAQQFLKVEPCLSHVMKKMMMMIFTIDILTTLELIN